MDTPRLKFQNLLRELFQFDCADLDFGIYRIMNQKRAMIEQFIEKDLLDTVAKELTKGVLKEQGDLAEQVAILAAKIREDIGDDALDADGKLDPKHAGIKLVRQYLELQERAAGSSTASELESQVFNHLWAFFSRYYDNGDFISTRRYSRREKYAIPYNGEEVYLHWTNRDQYYIKTGEYFTDYQWKVGDVSVLFKLIQAETEKDNVKAGKKRLFVPRLDEVSVDKKVVTIPFEYRALTEQEDISSGKKNQQDAIIAQAFESLPRRKALKESPAVLGALLMEYRKTEDGNSVSRLEHHLRRYTARNTRDYFIHKDLEGFLKRELDFYLKNEVLALDDLETGDVERADGWFQLLQAIRAIGGKIIMFLAQIENFQKRIFEKRKFVTETNYCFTLDRVPKTLWPKILNNKMQIEEWKNIYIIQDLKGYSEPLKQPFLETWPSLMVDTMFFADDPDFVDTLLASQKDLEESLGGLLVHSENFQALNLLLPRFKEQVKCIYIDPPYNTGGDGFLYKDGYAHSTWLTMITDRLMQGRKYLQSTGFLFVSIDENEVDRLAILADAQIIRRAGIIVIQTNPKGRGQDRYFATSHEYLLCVPSSDHAELEGLPKTAEMLADYNDGEDESGAFRLMELRNTHREFNKQTRPNLWFPLHVHKATGKVYVESKAGTVAVYPTWPDGFEGCWTWGKDLATQQIHLLVAKDTEDRIVVFRKDHAKKNGRMATFMPKTIWTESEVRTEVGQRDLDSLFGEQVFRSPKPIGLIQKCIGVSGPARGSLVCDFFAGSGTAAHAVLGLARIGSSVPRYLCVEMDAHFDAVLKPRIQKIVFSSDWKAGKPVIPKIGKSSGISHAFKYIRLESYEDTLGNIAFEGPQGELKLADYMLRYMLEFETRKSETLLNVEKLAAPFSYQLDIMDGAERKTKPVDLPETFNYLLGLKISSRKVHVRDDKHRYLVIRGKTNQHGEGGECEVVVIWRDVTGWKPGDFKADAEFVKKGKLTYGSDEVFVNADSVIPGTRVLDPVFKERMFAPVTV